MKTLLLLLVLALPARVHAEIIETGICVFGGSSAGIVATIQYFHDHD